MSESKEIHTLRAMAWERAKGELKAIMHTFWSVDPSGVEKYESMRKAAEDFIAHVEDHGLAE